MKRIALYLVMLILLTGTTMLSCKATEPIAFFSPSLYTEDVALEVGDGYIKAEPASVNRCIQINFQVTNVGTETHMFLAVVTDFAPGSLPVENGQVRSYTYVDEPQTMTWYSGLELWGSEQRARELPPDVPTMPPSPAEGPLIAPGGTKLIQLSWDTLLYSDTVFVLFCNCPGHYEQGEYTTLTVK